MYQHLQMCGIYSTPWVTGTVLQTLFFFYAVCGGSTGSAATDVATPVLVASGLIVALLAALF